VLDVGPFSKQLSARMASLSHAPRHIQKQRPSAARRPQTPAHLFPSLGQNAINGHLRTLCEKICSRSTLLK